MAKQNDDELNDVLSELAKAQESQSSQLSDLLGASNKSSGSGAIEEAAKASVPALSSGAVEVVGTIDEEESTRDEEDILAQGADDVVEAEAGDVDEPPVMVNEAVEALYAVQHEDDAAEGGDPLAALAMEAGGPVPVSEAGAVAVAVAVAVAAAGDEPEVFVAAAAIDLSQDMPASPRRSSAGSSSRTRNTKPAKPAASMQAVFAPILITFGILTLIPALWAVAVLMGMKVPMHDGQGADGMAKLMLICWPVSLGLLAGGIVSIVQVSKQNKKMKARELNRASR